MHADACNFHALRLHACMHCGSQLAADCHWIHSNCDKNFAGRRSLEKLYGEKQSELRGWEGEAFYTSALK